MIKKEGWEKKYLPEIAKISTGKWDANHAIKNGKYRFYTCAYDYQYCNTNRFSGECIILPGNGANVGEVFYYNGKFDAYQRTYVLSDIKILPKYLKYHMLLHWRAIGTKQQYGAATNFIKIGNFQNYHVEYPSLSIQHQIVSELDALSDIITKKKQQLEELDKLAQATFYDMFGDPVSNEKGWEVKKLGDLGNFKNGLNYKNSETGINIKILSVSNFKSNIILRDLEQLGYVGLDIEPNEDYYLKEKDIVFVRSNGSKELVGRCLLLEHIQEKITFSGFCIRFRLENYEVNPLFLIYILTNEHFKSNLIEQGRGANISNVNQQMLAVKEIILPPIYIQDNFTKIIESIEKQKELINQSISEVQQLFDYTMDKYFN